MQQYIWLYLIYNPEIVLFQLIYLKKTIYITVLYTGMSHNWDNPNQHNRNWDIPEIHNWHTKFLIGTL